MLLEKLCVRHFGRFDDYQIHLPQGTRFAVLYGENGTGKTTLLNAFRSVLFGIEEKTPYADPDQDTPVLSATFRDRENSRLDVKRYKRRKAPLEGVRIENENTLSERTFALEEATFTSHFSLPERKLYEKVFGFTLSDLESGAKVLEEATVGELLAGGALGGNARRVRELLDELVAQQEELYRPRSPKPLINQRKVTLEKRRTDKGKLLLHEATYQRQQQELRSSEGRIKTLEDTINQILQQEAETGRLLAAYPHWEAVCRLQAEIALTLSEQDGKADDGSRYSGMVLSQAHVAELRLLFQNLEVERRVCEERSQEVFDLETKQGRELTDMAVLESENQIVLLAKQAEMMARFRKEIPQEASEQDAEHLRLQRRLTALLPNVAIDGIEEEAFLAKYRDEVQRHHRDYQSIEAQRTQIYTKCAEKQLALDKESYDLAAMTQQTELPNELAALLPVLDERKQQCREWQQNDERLSQNSAELVRRHERLNPLLPRAISAEDSVGAGIFHFPLPAAGTLREMAEERRDRCARLDGARTLHSDAKLRMAQAEASLASLTNNLPAPHPETVGHARTARDKAFLAWETNRHDSAGRAAYLQTVQAADESADRLVEASERVARLAEERHTVDMCQAECTSYESAVQAAAESVAQWETDWRIFWSSREITAPCAPDGTTDGASVETMIAWRDEVAQLQEIAKEIAQQEAVRERYLKILPPFEARLRTAFHEANATPLGELITRLEAWAVKSSEAATLRRSCSDRAAAMQRELTRLNDDLNALISQRDLVLLTGQEYLRQIGLPEDMTLMSLASAEELLNELCDLRHKIDGWDAKQDTHLNKVRELSDFDETVNRLRMTLRVQNPSTISDTFPSAFAAGTGTEQDTPTFSLSTEQTLKDITQSEQFIATLDDVLRSAKSAHAVYCERDENLRLARVKAAEARKILEASEVERDEWLNRSHVSSEIQLLQLVEQTGQRLQLETEAQHAQALMEAALGTEGIRKDATAPGGLLKDRLQAMSVAALTDEREHLLDTLSRQRDELSAEQLRYAGLKDQANQRDGEDAAVSAAEYEEERAALQEEVEEYLTLFLGERVLRNVVEQFARDNQPALLKSASRLIEQITDGHYTSVRQSADEKTLALVPASGDGRACIPRTPERLSTGEREQLFLALRLAFVTHYCDTYEALPIVLDDVLVNFDERRAASTLHALSEVSQTTQVLFFTCHKDLRDLALTTVPEAAVVNLPNL